VFLCLSGVWWLVSRVSARLPRTTVYDAQTYHALHPVPPHCAPPRPTAHLPTLPALSPTTTPDIHRRRHRETSNFCSCFQRSIADQECAEHVAQHTFIRHFNVENMNTSLMSVSLSVCLFLSGDRRNTYHATKDDMCKLISHHNISATLKLRIEQVGTATRAESHNMHGTPDTRQTETPDTRQSNYKTEAHQTETPARYKDTDRDTVIKLSFMFSTSKV